MSQNITIQYTGLEQNITVLFTDADALYILATELTFWGWVAINGFVLTLNTWPSFGLKLMVVVSGF